MADHAKDAVRRDRNADRAHELGQEVNAAADEIARLRAAMEDGVLLDRAFARRLLALLSGYRNHLNEYRRYCPEGRNLPDAIDRLRSRLAAADRAAPPPEKPRRRDDG